MRLATQGAFVEVCVLDPVGVVLRHRHRLGFEGKTQRIDLHKPAVGSFLECFVQPPRFPPTGLPPPIFIPPAGFATGFGFGDDPAIPFASRETRFDVVVVAALPRILVVFEQVEVFVFGFAFLIFVAIDRAP